MTSAHPRYDAHLASSEGHAALLLRLAVDPDRAAARSTVAGITAELLEQTGAGLSLSGAALNGADLREFDLRGADLNRASLHGTNLSGAQLSGASMVCPGLERTRFAGAVLSGAYVHAFAAQVCDFSGADLSDLVDATGALFHGCKMVGARLDGANLSGSSFYQSILDDGSFLRSNLQSCSFVESSCARTRFAGATLDHASFTRSDLRGTDLRAVSGEGVVIQRPLSAEGLLLDHARLPALRMLHVNAVGVSAKQVSAPDSEWRRCGLPRLAAAEADLSGSGWGDVVLHDADLRGAVLVGVRWTRVLADGANLSDAKAEDMHVTDSSAVAMCARRLQARCWTVRNSDLTRADLGGAYLYRAMITGDPPGSMRLGGADLAEAVLVQAYLAGDLTRASLRHVSGAYARLNQCLLSGADLRGARLFEASMVKTDFRGSDLRGVQPPVFADRCPGLEEAARAAGEGAGPLARYLAALEAVIAGERGGST